MSLLIRFTTTDEPAPRVGLITGEARVGVLPVESISDLLTRGLDEIAELIATAEPTARLSLNDVTVLAPVDGRTEIWAAGVTYERSRDARTIESAHAATLYDRVYDAPRPELFFKSVAWKVRGPGEWIGIRQDSQVNVPEPELALVVNSAGETVGYSVCNDVSSRSIEGENALYLPQAKVYAGACALGPGIRPAWQVSDPYGLRIDLRIRRGGEIVWGGTASTAQLKRRLEDLTAALFFGDEFRHGAVLATGTCLVPELPFTLLEDDAVEIDIEGIGRLTNTVKSTNVICRATSPSKGREARPIP